MGGFTPKTNLGRGAPPTFNRPPPGSGNRPPSSSGGGGSRRDAERAALREQMRNASGDNLARLSDQYNALNFKK